MANKTQSPRGGPDPFRSPMLQTWQTWESLAINVYNFPENMTTFVLWESFKKYGDILSIDIFEKRDNRPGKGRIRFKPPPSSDIWSKGPFKIKLRNGSLVELRLELELNNNDSFIDSPVRQGVRYPSHVEIPATKFDVCVLNGENSFHVMRTFKDSSKVTLNARYQQLDINFTSLILDNRKIHSYSPNVEECRNLFRVRIKFIQLQKLWETRDPQSKDFSFLVILDSPALYFRRLKNLEHTFQSAKAWRESDAWSRQTAVVHNPNEQHKLTTNLQRSNQIIDIGRWNVLRITFSAETVDKGAMILFREIMGDHNISVQQDSPFRQSSQKPIPVWKWINLLPSRNIESLCNLEDQEYVHLPFPVRYQLEVCLSNGRLSEFTMTREFVVRLRDLGEKTAKRLLEHVATESTSYIDPMDIFQIKVFKGVSDAKIPNYCCFMRTARITPSTIHYNTPTVDTSNRIVRRYIEHADHFLRVRFTDEKTRGNVYATIGNSQDEVYTRIKRTLANGITIGDRHFEFLAFGNSQLREQGAYFFAPTPHLNAAQIRARMGELSHIKNIAKYAARLGQSFSTTRAFSGCKPEVRRIEDITRNGWCFSDGVGKVSPFQSTMMADEMNLRTPDGQVPSAFQFRLGGCKGMLVISQDTSPSEIHIRPSQLKFESPHGGLEIVRCSKLSTATLNRQLILVLTSLKVSGRLFHKKLNQVLESFDEAMQNDKKATGMLRKYIDPHQMSLCLAQMVDSGFRRTEEPFVCSMLALWKAWHLKLLKEKAKVPIEKGANLLGCLDEIGILRGHFEGSKYDSEASLPEIFVQVSQPEKDWTPRVITGVCILARNPSLHPGDIRVVRAVDVPELRYLRDVVVFPQTGDRDIPSMCSGGDLDGDDYIVIWDEDLIPPKSRWSEQPMKFTSKKAPDLDHEVTVDEMTSFFVTYMKNNILPRVARAHMAWGDWLPDGIRDSKCIRLARLHSDAVDYNKTGGAAVMTRDLEPLRWPHFMENKYKPTRNIYHSKTILGQLYDAVEKIKFVPHLSMPFDSRVLNCKPELKELSESFLPYARDLKEEYDSAIRRVMARYEIETEFEVWSSWVLDHNCSSRDYNIQEDIGQLSGLLRDSFRHQCYEKVGGRLFEALAPLIVAMYRVTHEDLTKAQEVSQYDDQSEYAESSENSNSGVASLPLISFPWLFYDHMGKIAQGHYDLNAIKKSTESKADNVNGKVYTQLEVRQLTSGLPIDGWSEVLKLEVPSAFKSDNGTTSPEEKATTISDPEADSVFEYLDKESQTTLSQSPDSADLTGRLLDLQLPDDEEDSVEEILIEDKPLAKSALNRLIDMMGE